MASPNFFHRMRCTSSVTVPASSNPARFRQSCAADSARSSQSDKARLTATFAAAKHSPARRGRRTDRARLMSARSC